MIPVAPSASDQAGADVAGRAELDRIVIDAVADGIVVVDAHGRIVMGNRRANEMFGFDVPARSIVGQSVDDLLPESLRDAHERHRGHYGAHPRTRRMGSGLELLGRRQDGSELPVEVSLTPVTVDGAAHVVAVVRDLTERRATQASLDATRDRLALVGERERIGRDLHDSVIQRLYGAGLAMQAALDGDAERLRQVVSGAVDEIDDTIGEIRSVIHDLQPDALSAGRLQSRLDEIAAAQAAALGIDVRVRIVGYPDAEPSPQVADAVLAVVRECIANAHRHGAATTVDVDVENGVDQRLRVTVHDDGGGFDPSRASGGFGLANLRARAGQFGGTFGVESSEGAGTQVVWEIPI